MHLGRPDSRDGGLKFDDADDASEEVSLERNVRMRAPNFIRILKYKD